MDRDFQNEPFFRADQERAEDQENEETVFAEEPEDNGSESEPMDEPKAEPRRTGNPGASPRNGSGRSAGGSGSNNRQRSGGTGAGGKKNQNPGNAGPKKTNNAKKIPIDLNPSRSSGPVHRVMPYFLGIFAAFILICFIFNLWNVGKFNAGDPVTPSDHMIGVVGYWICRVFFGMFGSAVFILPLLMFLFAARWRKYVDTRRLVSKTVAAFGLLLMVSTIIHVFGILGLQMNGEDWELSVPVLWSEGAAMRGGGFFGGLLAYVMVLALKVTGSLIIAFCLLAATVFWFIEMTPHHVWVRFRLWRQARSDERVPISERDAEAARLDAEKQERLRRATSRSVTVAESRENRSAVSVVPSGRRGRNELARIPMPHLEENDDDSLYLPTDLQDRIEKNKEDEEKRNEEERRKAEAHLDAGKPSEPEPQPAAKPAEPIREKTTEAPESEDREKKNAGAFSKKTANTPPQKADFPMPEPKGNKDAAIEQIFPRSNESRQGRRVAREIKNFDLISIFREDETREDGERRNEHKHAELPPERGIGEDDLPAYFPHPEETAAEDGNVTFGIGSAGNDVPLYVYGEEPKNAGADRQPAPASAAPAAPIRPTPAAGQKPISPAPVGSVSNDADEPLTQGGQKMSEFRASLKDLGAPNLINKKPPEPVKPPEPAKPAVPKPYVFPPVTYLHPADPPAEEDSTEIQENMATIRKILSSLRTPITEDIEYVQGPTITRYEVHPAPGIRVRAIGQNAPDIAYSLAAKAVRIEAPIPGKSAVGIEVPNKKRSTVYLRELLENEKFTGAKSKLTSALGVGVGGDPVFFDISKMPHLLVAGATGSGKSVGINCFIMSILFKARPDEVKLVLIDPKKVEFTVYREIPHLLAPIITSPEEALGALQACVDEMEHRFDMNSEVGVRDINGYNEVTADDPDKPFMPHIVIVIDELADLIMTGGAEIENAIMRIAQKARAAGIHLIIGTQRPSTDVITGTLKANIPSKIAFTVAKRVDSMVILDSNGAESLTGRGDMIFAPYGEQAPVRVQGAFVNDKEVEKICDFIRSSNDRVQYSESFMKKLGEFSSQFAEKNKSGSKGGDFVPSEDGKGEDPKFLDALRIAVEDGKISTSLLQRRLEIGYSRAAKLIDRMTEKGYVSPPDGSKPRATLISQEDFERVISGEDEAEGEEGLTGEEE